MAAPLVVPISNKIPRADDKPQPVGEGRVAGILARNKTPLICDWLMRAKSTSELNHLHLSDDQRIGHLSRLIDDIVERLAHSQVPTRDSDATESASAVEHGSLRRTQGYTAGMLIHESRILQVTIFGTLHKNLSLLDFNVLLPDVMTIADEVDSQLTQAMEGYADSAGMAAT
jgi:hypothetical protein